MKHKNGTPYSDEAWKRWYGMKSSSELVQEQEEYVEAQVDQAREDGMYSHGRR